jgi:hypothetical protein
MRLTGLLNSDYSPKELADEIGFTRRQVYRVYLPLGCPHSKDEKGHVFINGYQFRDWYCSTFKKPELGNDETACLACKRVVPLVNPTERQKGNYRFWASTCPYCGHQVSKAISNRRNND